MLEHIPQKADEGDCIVTCIALYCNVDYDRVMQSVPSDVIPYGMWVPSVLEAIEKISNKVPSVTTYNGRMIQQISRFDFLKKPAIYGCWRIEAGVWHYVFSDGERFYDPLLPDSIPLSAAKTDYHSGWLVMSMITDPR
jgi:hypothetical protein